MHPKGFGGAGNVPHGKGKGGGTQCRWGADCRKEGCTFVHPTAGKGGGTPCRWGADCRKEGCTFVHPSRAATAHNAGMAQGHGYSHPAVANGQWASAGAAPPVPDEDGTPARCWGRLCMWSDCRAPEHPRNGGCKPCNQGAACTADKESCPFAHPWRWFGPCPRGGSCLRLECPFDHAARRAACRAGAACADRLCARLHPEGALGAAAAAAATRPPLRKLVQRLRSARLQHQGKLADAADKAFALLAAADRGNPRGEDAAGDAAVEHARVEELQQQLASFDAACLPKLERLVLLSAQAYGKGAAKGPGGQAAAAAAGGGGVPEGGVDDPAELDEVEELGDPSGELDAQPAGGEADSDESESTGAADAPPEAASAAPAQMKPPTPEKEAKNLALQLRREIYRLQSALPALAKRGELAALLQQGRRCFVIRGETGSGKSTQLTQYLAEDFGGRVLCTQPRKVAATSLARRVAEEWGLGDPRFSEVGGAIGFHVGGARKVKPWTQVEYMTEEVLLQKLLNKRRRALDGVKAVILDEAHERTVKLDILLGQLHQLQRSECPDLCLVVTSATLDVGLFSRYLGGCPVINIPGRMYPVQDVYVPLPGDGNKNMMESVVQQVLTIHSTKAVAEGDILAFLPGQGEVEGARKRLQEILQKKHTENCQVFALHGSQDPEDQKPVFQPPPPRQRKVIFATNVAETSVTIDGVRFVVDSGVEKSMVFDSRRNLSSLEEVPISRSSATQRRGRAGRTASGTCYRLYSEDDFDAMRETQQAEVLSQPAHLTILTLLDMGLDPATFPWLEAPDEAAIRSAWTTLTFLGAVAPKVAGGASAGGPMALTDFGRLAAKLQIDPSWAKLLSVAHERGMAQQGAELVAIMSVSTGFFQRATTDAARQELNAAVAGDLQPTGDLVTMFRLYRQWAAIKARGREAAQEAYDFCKSKGMRTKAVEMARKTGADLLKQLRDFLRLPPADPNEPAAAAAEPSDADLCDLALAGTFLNLGVHVGGRDRTCCTAVYQVVRLGQGAEVTTGAIFPGSVLHKLGCDAARFVCVVQLMQTSRLFMHVVTPLGSSQEDLLAKLGALSPSFAQHLRTALPAMACEQVEVRGFTVQLLTGAQAARTRRSTEARFGCTVSYDVEGGAVLDWCQPQLAQDLRVHLEAVLAAHKERVMLEVEEELLGGETRAVYGKGGEVVTMLYAGECISVNVLGLHKDTTEDRFRAQMAKYGPLRGVSLVTTGAGTSESLFCQATFVDKASAAAALPGFRGDSKDLVNVKPGGVRAATTARDVSGLLRICWDITEQVGADDVVDARSLQEHVAELRTVVPLQFEEQPELETYFCERRVAVAGGKGAPQGKGGKRRAAASEETVKVAGFRVVYKDLETLQRAYQAWTATGRPRLAAGAVTQRMFDSLRCTICFQVVVSAHKAVFDQFLCPRGDDCCWSDCSQAHARQKRPCNQLAACTHPHCKFAHPRAFYQAAVAPQPEEERENPLGAALALCQRLGVKSVLTTRGAQTSVRLEHERLPPLTECRDAVLQAIACQMFAHPDKDLLFQKPGKAEMEALQKRTGAYLHWDRTSRTVRVFGRPADRRHCLEALAEAVAQLKQLHRERFLLSPQGAKKVREPGALEGLSPAAESVDLHGSVLEIWARSAQAAEEVRAVLQGRGWLKEVKAQAAGQDLCGLCMCDFDQDVWQLQACGHRFCTACLRNALAEPDGAHFPIRCPQPLAGGGGMCGQALVWRDLVGLCNGDVLARIRHLGVDAFLRDRPQEAMYCPKEGCNHIMRPPAPLQSPEDERQRGGLTVFCEECSVCYCLPCSQRAHKACSGHPGYTCAETEVNPDVQQHRHHIIETFLTLRCPRCKKAFLDYSGCAALTCDGCSCGFCAKCFADCGRDAHQHTSVCTGPGIPGIRAVGTGYWLQTQDFDRLNLQVAQYRVQDYLQGLAPEMRRLVVDACRNDFTGFPAGNLVV